MMMQHCLLQRCVRMYSQSLLYTIVQCTELQPLYLCEDAPSQHVSPNNKLPGTIGPSRAICEILFSMQPHKYDHHLWTWERPQRTHSWNSWSPMGCPPPPPLLPKQTVNLENFFSRQGVPPPPLADGSKSKSPIHPFKSIVAREMKMINCAV